MIVRANLIQCFCICAPTPFVFKNSRKAIKWTKDMIKWPQYLPVSDAPGVQCLYRTEIFLVRYFVTYVSSWLASSIEVKEIIFSFRQGCGSDSLKNFDESASLL